MSSKGLKWGYVYTLVNQSIRRYHPLIKAYLENTRHTLDKIMWTSIMWTSVSFRAVQVEQPMWGSVPQRRAREQSLLKSKHTSPLKKAPNLEGHGNDYLDPMIIWIQHPKNSLLTLKIFCKSKTWSRFQGWQYMYLSFHSPFWGFRH